MADPRRLTVYIPYDLLEKVAVYGDEHNRSVSYILQQAVSHWLASGAPVTLGSRKPRSPTSRPLAKVQAAMAHVRR